MDNNLRLNLTTRIRNFFIEEIRKEFGEDYRLVEHKVDDLIQLDDLKASKLAVKTAIIREKQELGLMGTEQKKQ